LDKLGIVKVRISKTPDEVELDGVRLDNMRPGTVREVSASIGTWLIAQRYAEPEMRSQRTHEDDFLIKPPATPRDRANHAPHRRSYER
jgi:hypothetical protein